MASQTIKKKSFDVKQLILIALTVFFSLNSVLVLYSANYHRLRLSDIMTSAVASLACLGILWWIGGRLFKRIETKVCFSVVSLLLMLSFSGFKTIYTAFGNLSGNITEWPNFLLYSISIVILAVVRFFGKQWSAPIREMIWLVISPIIGATLINALVNILVVFGIAMNKVPFRYAGLVGGSVMFLVALALYLRRHEISSDGALTLLISVSVIFGGLPLVTIAQSALITSESNLLSSVRTVPALVSTSVNIPTTESRPDIYWFVLDGYGRADMLKKLYSYDNSEFISWLRQQGFWIGTKSSSNYMRTHLSLATTLNMEHVSSEDLEGNILQRLDGFLGTINDNKVFTFLHGLGYETVAFPVGLYYVEVSKADVFCTAKGDALSDFELQFYSSTIFPDIEQLLTSFDTFGTHRNRFYNVWDTIPYTSMAGKPAFVLAHVISPHPPFIFDAEGNTLYPDHPYCLHDANNYRVCFNKSSEDYARGYLGQLKYVNKLLKKKIAGLLAQSPQPVIIVSGDHGPGGFSSFASIDETNLFERFSILNAIYIPDGKSSKLNIPEATSSINTFPVVLNSVFGTNFPMQQNKSFYTLQYEDKTTTEDVTERLATLGSYTLTDE
jgi:hypothetical protein